MVTIQVDIQDFTRLANRMVGFARTEAVKWAGFEAANQIRQLTAGGLDAHGNRMQSYTPEYAKRRQKMGLQISFVDLRVTGALMGSLGMVEDVLTVDAGLMDQAEGLLNLRNWLDVSLTTAGQISLRLAQGIERLT